MLGRNLAVAGRADKPGNLKDKQFLEKKTMEVPGETSVMTESPMLQPLLVLSRFTVAFTF